MNAKDLAKNIDKQAQYRINGLSIPVTIKDAKSAYGRIDYQIEPVGGSGQIWVASGSVKL